MAEPGVPGPLALRAGEYQRRDANGVSNKINRGYEFEPQRIDPETVATETPNLFKRLGTNTNVLMYDLKEIVHEEHSMGGTKSGTSLPAPSPAFAARDCAAARAHLNRRSAWLRLDERCALRVTCCCFIQTACSIPFLPIRRASWSGLFLAQESVDTHRSLRPLMAVHIFPSTRQSLHP